MATDSASSRVREGLRLSDAGVTVVRAGVVAWTGIGLGILVYAAAQVIAALRVPMLALGAAALLVALLEPGVARLERRIPRWGAVSVVYAAVLTPVGFAAWWLVRRAAAQLQQLAADAPDIVGGLERVARPALEWLEGAGVTVPADPAQTLEGLDDRVLEGAGTLLTAATQVTTFVLAMVVGLVLAFYLLVALPRIRTFARAVLPPQRRDRVVEGVGVVGDTVAAFLRGQLLIAAAVGVLSTIGLMVIGVPYAVLVGAIAGVTNLIPFFGPIVGSVPGILLGWATGGGWMALAVLAMFVAVQQFESSVLSPLILGATVRLRPVTIMIGMLAAFAAMGILGMLLAVPAMASAKALYLRFRSPAAAAR